MVYLAPLASSDYDPRKHAPRAATTVDGMMNLEHLDALFKHRAVVAVYQSATRLKETTKAMAAKVREGRRLRHWGLLFRTDVCVAVSACLPCSRGLCCYHVFGVSVRWSHGNAAL
jgi:hypothetical protein